MNLNEARTRAQHIDSQLRAADWKLNDRTHVRLEVPVDGYDAEPWNGVTDYCLHDPSGNVLAGVEAKVCCNLASVELTSTMSLKALVANRAPQRNPRMSRPVSGWLGARIWVDRHQEVAR